MAVKRESDILKAFETLGFSPRSNQTEIIDSVLSAYLDEKYTNVILCAGTGVGKSIIAAVIANVLQTVNNTNSAAIYLSSTNVLVNQYADSFSNLSDNKFFRIKGASNYKCDYFNQKGNDRATADECVFAELTELEQLRFCTNGKCEYKRAQKLVNETENLITNYAYFMLSKLKTERIIDRPLQVFDEMHLLNDTYCSQLSIEVSLSLIDRLCKEMSHANGKLNNEMAELVLFKQQITNKQITIQNYREKLKDLAKIYAKSGQICLSQSKLIPDLKDKAKFNKLAKRFFGLIELISTFIVDDYEHVFDNVSDKDAIFIKPIFIRDKMESLLGKYNLFMTATMSPYFAETTMGLTKESTKYIAVPDVFPATNKPVFFLGADNLNYDKMKDPKTYIEMSKKIAFIVDHHKGEKGLLMTPSFYVTKTLASKIPKGCKVFEHTQGTNINDYVAEFRNYKGSAILISPSIFEGLDFSNDESRYQIICKTPYASLGDPRIAKIASEYGSVYREITLYKIIQGLGRSIRTPTDTACTYFLDKSSETMFNSKQNLWKNRFSIKY